LASKHEFTSHQKLAIKKYIIEFPICSLQQIISALELDVHKSTLCRYLQYQNIEIRPELRGPLLRPQNVIKRLEFACLMVDKSDEIIKSIFWTDEFTIQSWPNGEITFYWAPRSNENRSDIVSAKIQNGGVRVMFWASMT
jgi:hypothetical protein